MNAIREIRTRLNLSQKALAGELGCSQGNVSFYERGQTVPPAAARRLIELAAERGVVIGYDDIYGAPQQNEAA